MNPDQQPSFVPRFAPESDRISRMLRTIAQYTLIALFTILPIIFVPGLAAATSMTKTFIVVVGLVVVVILTSLSMLRIGVIPLRVSPLLLAWWGIALSGIVAALLAPQMQFAFFGEAIEIHTVSFLVILGLVMTVMQLFRGERSKIAYLFGGLLMAGLVVSLHHIVRLIGGPDVLSFGAFPEMTTSLVGSFNDMAIFLMLSVLAALVAVVQIQLSKLYQVMAWLVIVLSLVMLSVVNFSIIWLVLCLFSLLLLFYTLTRDRFGERSREMATSNPSLNATLMTVVIFVVSVLFLVGGSSLGSAISNKVGVSFLEVRPSISATLDITRSVYAQNALTGVGPNHFSEAWVKFRDPSLNETLFWDTPFAAGSGYVPTWFVTTGLIGIFTWLLFFGFFIWTGAQALLRPVVDDTFWYFVATVSFMSGLLVWLISFLYVPGPVILILGAVFTGLLVVAHNTLVPKQYPTVNLLTSTRTGFVLIALVMFIIIGIVLAGYQGTRQWVAAYTYLSAVNDAATTDPAALTARLAKAYDYYPSDVFMREIANLQLVVMTGLINQASSDNSDQQSLQQAIQTGLEASGEAIRIRPNDSRNWRTQGNIFGTLAAVGVEGSAGRATEAFNQASALDPNNPFYVLQRSYLAARAQDNEAALREAEHALSLKSNYTDALLFVSQLQVAAGKLPEAIAASRSLISLEPRNPGRYYQLGVLLSASNDRDGAIDAFSAALELNPQYANARYLRALEYFAAGNRDLALSELRLVRDLNPDNAVLGSIIGQIESGEVTPETLSTSGNETVAEPDTVSSDADTTTTTEAPDTDLLTPVNGGGEAEAEDSEPTTAQ